MKRVLGAVAITAGVLAGMSGCLPIGGEEEHRTVGYVVAEPVRELVVEGINGGVVVNGGGDGVHVVEKQNYKGGEPKSTHEVKDGVLKLTYDCGRCGIGYTVQVPAGTKVRVKSGNGGVKLTGLAGETEADATNGGVEASGLRSPRVRLSAVDGGVRADFAVAPSMVEASTSNGGVRLRVPAGEAYAVDARASVGGVELGIPSQPGAARSISARAETGGVTVTGV
ncbi:DUF4097 family beta strand repeat-containing protein [Streptomyces sp. CBMA156]|uniref:DUF4097 family beta strand repeat-containing protein n=1 Tax=Streptomyces sp. CBMA156 TaxID=1930280 RepID=UPI001661BD8C|nr:DUF4097 family beta strand repeat-containing protein [Streptomyces sp. CBMA156]MBD0669859.1 hypothetical protein [Streptomyces sp. CBMA156]